MSENNFESLRQLLAQKRHEVPPPGHFNSFSGQIIARIRAGEGKMTQTASEESWFMKLLQAFEFKPAFAGAFASALSLLLVVGIIYAERPDSGPQPILQSSFDQSFGSFAAMSPAALAQTALVNDIATNNNATSLQPVASLFGSQNTFAQPVSFSLGGN